ncbi:molybdopterin-binding protein [Methylobacterium nodulans]|uniref:Molybdopterin binding domain protein n=1 Tax=Methylobacterium nodulans (strain LMG 21967 / CNCM I-2342 / ORS 2060) TaxID=460265 RepID=B8IR44_METNO|nr:molybdopterin-binding protein [Methylobacterium nodulans]ACL56746.1 molybdopterin binding domain protein [Methylobacterium nodulans ORS 2060]
MRFGPVPVAQSVGLISAHSVRAGGAVLRKGSRIGPEAARLLAEAGLTEIVAVALEPGDVPEDEAARAIAEAVAGEGIEIAPAFTGRANLHARTAGVLVLDSRAIEAVNTVDEAVTLATLAPFKPVVPGEMVGTVKIIPYAVAGGVLQEALGSVARPALAVAPYRRRRVAAISTLLPGLKDSVVDKTLRVLAGRLAPAGAELVSDARIAHTAEAVTAALRQAAGASELVVVFGASAIADRRDVIPSGIEAAGGRVDHLGMPVDPGNLLLLGRLGDVPVIGAPGCARSPKENGFDWVLHRLLAGLPVGRADLVALGVGGLLMEIVSRPQPRAGGAPEDLESEG